MVLIFHTDKFAGKKFVDDFGLLSVFEGVLECLKELAVKLLHVLLLEHLIAVPAERLGQSHGADGRLLGQVQEAEELLQLERDAHLRVAVLLGAVGPLVDGVAELGRHKQRLEQGVHVAGGALVQKPHILGALALRGQGSLVVDYEFGRDRRRGRGLGQ